MLNIFKVETPYNISMKQDNPDDLAEIPKGTLPVTRDMLRKYILNQPQKAWDLLKKNPVAVVALPKLREQLENDPEVQENKHYLDFKAQFEEKLKNLFDIRPIMDELGMALTIELLSEIWRRAMQDFKISSIQDNLIQSLSTVYEHSEVLENTSNNTVIRGMVDYALKRVLDFQEYELMKAKQHWEVIQPTFEKIVEEKFNKIPDDKIPDEWQSWFYFATASNLGVEYFRNQIAGLIFPLLNTNFSEFTEETKYQVAPWLSSFNRVMDQENFDVEN